MTRKHFRKSINRIAASRGDAVPVWSQGKIDRALRSGQTPEQFYKQHQDEHTHSSKATTAEN
jgi:hypothetical protein